MFACCGVSAVSVIVGGVTSLALGSLWYSSFMFGNCSKTSSMPQMSIGSCFVAEFINSSIATWALFVLLNFLEPATFQDNLYYGLLISLASGVPAAISGHIWKNADLTEVLVKAGFSVAVVSALIVVRSYLG